MARLFFSLALLLAAVEATVCEEISMPPSADTSLFELDPGFNTGGQRDIAAGALGSMAGEARSRALYRFDISGRLPEGAEIAAARLRIDVVKTPEGSRNSTFGIYRALADWGEGTKRGDIPGGDPADEGEATWFARFHPDQRWSAPGGAFGSDFATEPGAERFVLADGSYVFDLNETGLADLRDWLVRPETNFGWVLATREEEVPKTARRWASREHRTDPPALEIEFSSPDPPEIPLPTLTILVTPEGASIRFLAEPGIVYQLERSIDLTAWEAAGEPTEVQETQTIEFVDAAAAESVYYRVSARNSSGVHP